MSKQYFITYLRIEDEIKENKGYFKTQYVEGKTEVTEKEYYENGGDELNPVGEIEGDKVYIKGQGGWYYKEECINVKPFLCSRDIQVGDKVLDEEFCEWIVVESDMKNTSMLTKVIGEVSPDSLGYVEEGNEYDETDLRWRVTSAYYETRESEECGEFEEVTIYLDLNEDVEAVIDGDELLEQYVEVKGPCGHYH